MVRKLLLASLLLVALPLALESSSAAACKKWNAKNKESHHRAGPIDVVGGKGYGSGFHQSTFRSPPQPLGAYGDPKRRAAQGGYVSYDKGNTYAQVNLFGPLDETDTGHLYDTSFGACVSNGTTGVNTGQKCSKTSQFRKPNGTWTPCGGY